MSQAGSKKPKPKTKSKPTSNSKRANKTKGLHQRNLHRNGYDFPSLVKSYPKLAPHVEKNAHGNLSIKFADPKAVKALNAALLKFHYDVDWDLPEDALCPPVPGRADYIHYVADLLGYDEPASDQSRRSSVRMLDIGTGANGIYPLLACQIYGWHCVGSDINTPSLENVASILDQNPDLKERFILRRQHDKHQIFQGIIQEGEFFDVTVCNPPFHASEDEALKSNRQKTRNLARHRGEATAQTSALNFGGLESELWCNGGERLFLKKLIKESRLFADQCRWFTSLVSKSDNIKPSQKLIRKLGATDIQEIEMAQGNKITRILAWTFV